MNHWKAVLGYMASIGGTITSMQLGLPWWATTIIATIGTAAAHLSPAPGQSKENP